MDEQNTQTRLARVEERAKSNTHRLDNLEELSNSIHEQTATIKELVTELKYTNKSVSDHEERLDNIEKKPAKHMAAMTNAIISTIAGGIASAAVSALVIFLKG